MKAPTTSRELEPLPVVQDSLAGGQNDRDHPSLLDPNQYSKGVNIEIRSKGLGKTRRGKTMKTGSCGAYPQGAIYFKPLSGSPVIFQVNNGKFWTWGGSGMIWTQIGATTLNNTTEPVGLEIVNGILYVYGGTSDNTYSWNGSAASFTDEGNTNTDPPRASIIAQQSGRIAASIGTGSNGDYIYFSDIFDGTTFDRTSNNKRVPTSGSEPVTALAAYRKAGLLAWTLNSTHIFDVTGSTVSSFERLTLDPKIGCLAKKTVVVAGDDAFFMSADRHIRSIKRNANDQAFGITCPISYLNPNLVGRINESYAHLCAGVFFDNYYLVAAPMDNNTRNSAVIPFDLLHQVPSPSGPVPACLGEWTNIAASDFVVTSFSNISQLYYIDSSDGSAYLMFDGTADDGSYPSATLRLRGQHWDAPHHDKTLHSGELQLVDSIGELDISYAKDDSVFTPLLSSTIGDTSAAILPINLPFNLAAGGVLALQPLTFYRRGRSRYWQLEIVMSDGIMNLRQATLRAWVEMMTSR